MRASLPVRFAITAVVLLESARASAYCRTTTCGEGECETDPKCRLCVVGGQPLFWTNQCLSFSIHQDGSPKHDISPLLLRGIVQEAFITWISADCGEGTHPSA